jgi:putative spermidine/putrescine transport system substrate-binding protein
MKPLKFCTIASVSLLLMSLAVCGAARAQATEEAAIVIGVTGGVYEDVQRSVFFEPFTKATGIKVLTAPNPSIAKVKAMVDAQNTDIDLAELTGSDLQILARRGLLEQLDYSAIPKGTMESISPPQAINKYGLGMFVWATGIAYNTNKYSKDNHPHTWAEFWDVKKFPGPRTLPTPGWLITAFEMALMADGVPQDKLYPLDIDRAFKSLDKIRPSVVKWYGGAAEAAQLVVDGHADLAGTSIGRMLATKERGGPIDVEYNQGMAKINYWGILKGAKHPKNAMKFIAFYEEPQRLGQYANSYPALGPINTKAFPYIDKARLPTLATSPENWPRLAWVDESWWAAEDSTGKTNFEKVYERWNVWILGK